MKAAIFSPKAQENNAKLTLMGLFLAIFAIFANRKTSSGSKADNDRIQISDIVLVALATLRLGRMVSYDLITEPLRKPFVMTIPDSTGAGDSIEARGEGVQRTLGQMLSCPICVGTWISASLIYALKLFPNPARLFLAIFSASGLEELLNSIIEALCWVGQLAREVAGTSAMSKAEGKKGMIE